MSKPPLGSTRGLAEFSGKVYREGSLLQRTKIGPPATRSNSGHHFAGSRTYLGMDSAKAAHEAARRPSALRLTSGLPGHTDWAAK